MDNVLHRFIAEELKDVPFSLLRAAYAVSDGPFSQSELNRRGNPYAVAHRDNAYPSGSVNRQTGAFYNGWGTVSPMVSGGVIYFGIDNDDPKARLLEKGTNTTVPREYRLEIIKTASPWFRRQVGMKVAKGIRKYLKFSLYL